MTKYEPVDEAIAEFYSANPRVYISDVYTRQIERRLRWHYLPFLQRTGRRRDQVTLADFIAFERELLKAGKSAYTIRYMKKCLVAYYRLLADKLQIEQYRKIARDLTDYRTAKVRESVHPWEAYPIDMLPKMLTAARSYDRTPKPWHLSADRNVGNPSENESDPNEDYVLVTLGVYVAMRSSVAYGLQVAAIDFANRTMNVRVKGGATVPVILHSQAAQVLREHLNHRTYKSKFVFRYGREPSDDGKARANNTKVEYAMARIGKAYVKLYGKADYARALTTDAIGREHGFVYHAFRDTIGRYARQFGLDEEERALLLSHAAKTITQHYSRADIEHVRKRWERIDLGNAAWVEAHKDSGKEVTANGDKLGEWLDENKALRAEIATLSRQLGELLDENKALRAEIAKLRVESK